MKPIDTNPSMPRRRFLKTLAVPGGLLAVSQALTQACGPAGPASSGGRPASSDASTKGPIRLGRLDTFTGPAASSGVAAKMATDLLIEQVREQGGVIDGRQLEVEYFDGGGQLAEEINGFKRFGQDPSIVASVGQGINWAGDSCWPISPTGSNCHTSQGTTRLPT